MNLGDWLRHMASVCLMCVSTWLFVVSYFLRFPLFEGRFGRFMMQLVLYPVLLWLRILILVAVRQDRTMMIAIFGIVETEDHRRRLSGGFMMTKCEALPLG